MLTIVSKRLLLLSAQKGSPTLSTLLPQIVTGLCLKVTHGCCC